MPPMFSKDDWFDYLDDPVAFDEAERQAPAHIRSHCSLRLRRFYQPLPQHLDLALRIDEIIRQGYVGRNPNNAERGELLQKLYRDGQNGSGETTNYSTYEPISSISLIGASGMGKSTTTERILSRYPQLLFHKAQGLHQVVYMKLDCPHDGNIKQLAKDFIFELDKILQTDFYNKLPRRISTDELLQHVKHLAATYSVGLLVIDEIQNLSVKKSGGREAMMNFFQELCNTLRVPIMLMGTMKAMSVLQLDFRQARRNTAVGSFAWEPMKNDETWQFFLEELWENQWLQEYAPLTPEFIDLLYKETQGIIAVLSTAFIMAQLRALRTGEEKLTEELFSRVMQKDMAPIQPMLKALRSGDARRIAAIEDIAPMNLEDMLKKEQQATLIGDLKRRAKQQSKILGIEDRAISVLESMGFGYEIAKQAVNFASGEGAKTHSALVRIALNKLSGDTDEPNVDDPADLRQYSQSGGVDSLYQDGVIKD